MAGAIRKLLIGVSVIAGTSAIASLPAQALTLTPSSIQFNTTNYRTYSGGNQGQFSPNNLSAARTALTDGDDTSNVELWYTNENPTSNVGFSGTFDSQVLGTVAASVSSVTAADWSVFGNQWLNGLLAANSQINNIWNGLPSFVRNEIRNTITTTGLPSSGDPNIGALTLDEATGKIDLALAGNFDLRPRILVGQYSTGNNEVDQFLLTAAQLINGPIQASEVAKLTVNDQTYYAYSFSATPSGIATTDGSESYTAIYHFDPQITITPPPTESVPEPTMVLGLIGVGGFLVSQRKRKTTA